jgi:hypothetical protein
MARDSITTTDLSDFGRRELRMAGELLTAYAANPPDWMGDGVQVMLNRNSGYVFLTDEDCNCAMMNGDDLDAWLSTPYEGHEGFVSDLLDEYKPDDLHRDDLEFIREWAERLDAELPEAWQSKDEDDEA